MHQNLKINKNRLIAYCKNAPLSIGELGLKILCLAQKEKLIRKIIKILKNEIKISNFFPAGGGWGWWWSEINFGFNEHNYILSLHPSKPPKNPLIFSNFSKPSWNRKKNNLPPIRLTVIGTYSMFDKELTHPIQRDWSDRH